MTSPPHTASQSTRRALRGVDDDRMVTGEGVLIDVPATSVGSLVLAALIDVVLIVIAVIAGLILLIVVGPHASQAQMDILSLLLVITAWLVVPVAVETLSRGRSLGKLVMKLRVVRDDGGPITFRHAFVRGLVGVFELWMLTGVPAVISSMVSTRAKRLGDFAAGTYVVREETSMELVPAPTMPPGLADWAARADMTALPDGLALQIRQYLTRTDMLTPVARHQVGQSLLQQTLPRVSPAPPTSAPLDAVLAAVLAERRRRDALRMRRDAELRERLLPDSRQLS